MDKMSQLKEELKLTETGREFLENVELPKHTNSLSIIADDRIKPYKKVDAIPIPEGATNGDVIMALFPYVQIEIIDNTVYTNIDNGAWFSLDWWNAPYNKEVE